MTAELELSASMMCADFSCLRDEVRRLEEAGIDLFHVDIMDGSFVDNFGMGYQDMECIRRFTTRRMEAHLMVREPYHYLDILYDLGIDIIYIHPEVDSDPATTLEKIRRHGAQAGIALNPGTSLALIEELLNVADRVLVLGVNPGHAGRAYQDYVDGKLTRLLAMRGTRPFTIALDGSVTMERIAAWQRHGISSYVLGTATLFRPGADYAATLQAIRALSRDHDAAVSPDARQGQVQAGGGGIPP